MPPEPASCAGCGAPLRRREGAWCHRCRQDRASASPPPQPPAGPCGGRTSLMISRLGRLLAEAGPASPQSILERARRPGKSAGTLARALEEFFTEAGLAFPVDHAARRAAARCQARVEEAPATLRPALARYAAALAAGQQRARQAGTRPRADATIAGELAILSDLASVLAAERGKTDCATTQAADLAAFLSPRPPSPPRALTPSRASLRSPNPP